MVLCLGLNSRKPSLLGSGGGFQSFFSMRNFFGVCVVVVRILLKRLVCSPTLHEILYIGKSPPFEVRSVKHIPSATSESIFHARKNGFHHCVKSIEPRSYLTPFLRTIKGVGGRFFRKSPVRACAAQ